MAHHEAHHYRRGGSGRESSSSGGGPVNEVAEQVLLTNYKALELYMNECHTIRRESGVYEPPDVLDSPQSREQHRQSDRQHASPGDSARGTDHESSEEEENEIFLNAVGFGNVIDDVQRQVDSGVNSDDSGELDTHVEGLTPSHALLIKKRVHTYRSTLRHKQHQKGEGSSPSTTRGDVRDLFPGKNGRESTNHVADGSGHGTSNHSQSYKLIHVLPPIPKHRSTPPPPPPKPKSLPPPRFPSHPHSSIAMPTTSRGRASTPEPPPTSHEQAVYPFHHSSSSSELLDLPSTATSRRRSGSEGTSASAIFRQFQSSPILARRSDGRRKAVISSPEHGHMTLHFGTGSPVKGAGNGLTDYLPRFIICPEPLGIARTIDISPHEYSKFRSLALLELQLIFDYQGLPLRLRRPIKHKNLKERGVFGVPLNRLLEQDQQRVPSAQLPLVFTEMLDYLERKGLEEEGLLRKCGSTTRVKSMADTVELMFNCGVFSLNNYMTSDKERKISDVASLLKQFLRQLPVPLLTRQYMMAFATITDIRELKEQVRALNLLILTLPDLHQRVLKRLMEFLQRVMDNSSQNKMTLTNIAMVMAPNLFTHLPTKQTLDDVAMAAKTSHVMKLLINYHDLLWMIPPDLLQQVRVLNECEVKRVNQRNLQRATKQAQDREPVIEKKNSYMVPIYGPLYLCVRKNFHFKADTTAADVLEKFEHKTQLNKDLIKKRFCQESEVAGEDFDPHLVTGPMFLHEVGGNIVERCLPPETNMYLLYEANPTTDFVIKPRHCPDILPVR
jgi:hypothetical protein